MVCDNGVDFFVIVFEFGDGMCYSVEVVGGIIYCGFFWLVLI